MKTKVSKYHREQSASKKSLIIFSFCLSAVLNFYCRKHPTAKLPYPNSCAKFQDCSKGSASRLSECTYPDLFSTQTGKCENFTTVKCDKRPEPQAPCKCCDCRK